MADNVTLDAGSGGDDIAADDISSVKYQRVKLTLGADGVNDGDVASGNPLPITHAALTELAAAIDTEVQVDVVGALPAGTNNIGDVDVASLPSDTFVAEAGALGLGVLIQGDDGTDRTNIAVDTDGNVQVDVVASALPTGAATAAKQPALGTAGTPSSDVISIQGVASGTVVPVSDGDGALTVDNSGTFAVQVDGDALTALQLIDDAVYTDDIPFTAGSNKVMAAGFRYDDVTPDTVQQGDIGYARMSSRREVFVAVRDAAGNERGMNVDASGNITANINGTVTVGSHAVTNAGTFAVQEDGAALTALQVMDDWDNAASDGASVSGDVAHDSADAGEPVKVGAKAIASLSGQTLVAANDRTNVFAGLDGVLFTRPHCNLEDIVTGNASNTDGTSTAVIAASGDAAIKHYLVSVILTNTSSSMIYVEIKDGATAKLTIPVPAEGGAIYNPPVPIPGTANTAWNFDASGATTTLYCSAVAFKSKV